jgi:hypothetical protein
MVLMHAVCNFIPPDGAPPHKVSAVAFAQQDVAIFKSVLRHVSIRHIDRLDLSEVEVATLDVGHAEIRARVFPWSVGRAFL